MCGYADYTLTILSYYFRHHVKLLKSFHFVLLLGRLDTENQINGSEVNEEIQHFSLRILMNNQELKIEHAYNKLNNKKKHHLMDCYLEIYRTERNRRMDVQWALIRARCMKRDSSAQIGTKKLVIFLCDQNMKVKLCAETWHKIKTVDKMQNTGC
jgi:hypothetical protein